MTSDQVKERQRRYGRNEVAEKQPNPVLAFAKKFWGLTAWMLEVAIVLSFVLGKFLDVYIITALLLVNAILGFIQERQATRAVGAFKQRLQLKARVLRDGIWQTLNAAEVVPGDVIRARSGDFVPADFKILDAEATVDQSAITGESLPIDKKTGDVVYSGSLVRKGEVTGVVTATGVHTYFGKTTQLVQLATPKLHMEGVISSLMKVASCFGRFLACCHRRSFLDSRGKSFRCSIFSTCFACVCDSSCFANHVYDYHGFGFF